MRLYQLTYLLLIYTCIRTGDTASMHTIVTCNLTGYVVGTNTAVNDELSSIKKVDWENLPPTQTPFESLQRQSYKVGEGDAVPGIELALRHSRVGEILRVRCAARFAYGHIGRPAVDSSPYESPPIAPHSDLEYQVEILSHLSEGQIDPQLLAVVRGGEAEEGEGVDKTRHLQRLQALTELMQRKEAGNRWFIYSGELVVVVVAYVCCLMARVPLHYDLSLYSMASCHGFIDFARAARAYSKVRTA